MVPGGRQAGRQAGRRGWEAGGHHQKAGSRQAIVEGVHCAGSQATVEGVHCVFGFWLQHSRTCATAGRLPGPPALPTPHPLAAASPPSGRGRRQSGGLRGRDECVATSVVGVCTSHLAMLHTTTLCVLRCPPPAPCRPVHQATPVGSAGRSSVAKTPQQLTPGVTECPPTSAASRASRAGRSTPRLSNSHTASS